MDDAARSARSGNRRDHRGCAERLIAGGAPGSTSTRYQSALTLEVLATGSLDESGVRGQAIAGRHATVSVRNATTNSER